MNDPVHIEDIRILSDNHYTLKKVTFSFRRRDGSEQRVSREAYDRGNGAAVLLYNIENRNVVLTRQFRLPAFLNHHSGYLIEAAAGLLDDASPEVRIKAKAEEETGYSPVGLRQVFDVFMSPGAVTERLYLFVAAYDPAARRDTGGGLAQEGEDIEVLELAFDEAMAMIGRGEIMDAKTIILLQYAALNIFSEPTAPGL